MPKGDITEVNANWYATVYPSEIGWKAIRRMLHKKYDQHSVHFDVEDHVNKRLTEDGGYRDQLWCILNDLGPMWYNGTQFLESTSIRIEHE